MDAAASCALLLLLLVSASVLPSSALKLPSYINPCSKNDPNLNDCAYKHAQEAIPSILKGDRKYNVPAMNPLKVSQIKVSPGDGSVGLGITFNDVNLYGVTDAIIKETNFDLAKNEAVIKASVPVAQMVGKYVVDGKILLVPIKGNGDCNITLSDNTNKFLNENWQDVAKEIGPALAEALAAVVTQILSGITNLVPYDEVFPESV
ncbi:protein takeout-like isoform X2 [Schistocerca piceifrons]|uniref:protein takeout-like isoform X2 n=1 Tax=Schistocerca piceifrons TaxID=274613 RepID=UPI001F5E51A7|nr:protein takeout-like isoform X2 [Schistocerca piceifrons]